MYSWLRDLRFGLRTLVRYPGFMLSALIALSLGIGANTAIFSVINSVVLKPLPYESPAELAVITETNPGKGIDRLNVSLPDVQDWRDQTSSFSHIAVYNGSNFNFRNIDQTDRIQGLQSSANLFQVLGVEPAIGRTFLPDDDQPGKGAVVIVSHRFWEESMHGDKAIIGQPVVLDSKSYTVIGVMPKNFQFPPDRQNVDVWVPLVPGEANNERGSRQLQVVARLKPGVTIDRAQVDLGLVNRRLQDRYPESNTGVGIRTTLLKDDLTKDVKPALFMLMGTMGKKKTNSCLRSGMNF